MNKPDAARRGTVPEGPQERPVEDWLTQSDGMPGRRAALRPGTLPEPPPDPQGDENRDPPPVTESGAGPYRRTMDLMHNTVSPSGNRQRGPAKTIDDGPAVTGTSDGGPKQ
jgi:hypothetical protein